tara:strand:+ start:662 stop:3001 length:2340 start_codon:yes stop_codon:yes gene_type:complete
MATDIYSRNRQQQLDHDKSLSLRDYYFVFRTYYKLIVGVTIIGFCIAFYSNLTLPPRYTATSSVAIREKPGAGMIMDLTGNRDRNRMSNEIQLIKSRSVAKGTIESIWDQKKNNLALFDSYPFYPRGKRIRVLLKELFSMGLYDSKSNNPIQYTQDYDDGIGERFADRLLAGLSTKHRPGTDIIDISYTSVWPHEAQLIINNLVEVYKEFEMKISGEYAGNTVEFLETILEDHNTKLEQSEKEFTNYKNQERMYDLDGTALMITTQVANIESEIYNAVSEINIRREKYNLLKSKLSVEEKILAERLLNNINVQVLSLRGELGKLESLLIQNIAQHGENHGAVKDLKEKLEGLKEQLRLKINELTKMGIITEDPLLARQNIVTELITLDSEKIVFELKKKESEALLNIYLEKLNDLPEKQLQFSRLQRNSIILNENYSLLRKQLEEAKINLAVQVGKVHIVDYARLPFVSGQNKNRMLLMGLFLGLALGLVLALALEILDNTIKTTYDIERQNLAVLGIIPSIGEEQQNKKGYFFNKPKRSTLNLKRRLITQDDPKSPVSEAYRSLRTSMLYTSADKEIKSILVSSAGPGEGKTTTVANLAITYANLGKKTLLIDTDLRRPVVHKVLGINKEPGITDYLSNYEKDLSKIIQSTDIKNLYVISSGIIPPNPSELLGSDRMSNLLRDLEDNWDMILFDSPPLVAVTDAAMVSKEIDQIVMVVKVGQTDKKAFDHTITSLRNVGAPISGVVLNAVTHKNSYGAYYYYYQYYHYYGSEKETEKA